VPKVSTITETGCATPIAIGDLHLGAIGQPGGHDVLGDPSGAA